MTFPIYSSRILFSACVLSSMLACMHSPIFSENYKGNEIIIESEDFQAETQAEVTALNKATQPSQIQNSAVSETPEKTYETFSSASAYWKNALEHLQHGREDEAAWALQQALKLDPNSKISKQLLHQIDADATKEFGTDSFEYEVQYGDSMAKIAKKYLNDPLKFYSLAKYNNITNPSRLVAGKVINIPGEKPEIIVVTVNSPVATEITTEEVPDTIVVHSARQLNKTDESRTLKKLQADFNESEYDKVIIALENSNLIERRDPEAVQLLVNSYFENANLFSNEGATQHAKNLLLKATELQPDNPEVNMALINMEESTEAENIYDLGLRAFAENRVVDAYDFMNHVIELQPNHQGALQKREEIKLQLVPHYYKRALMAQRKQKLDEAIEQWDEVLALDSSNESAKIYRSKAMSLRTKLNKLSNE